MGRPYSIGICTPVPMVPVNGKGWLDGTDTRKKLGLLTPEWHRARLSLLIPPGHSSVEVYEDGEEVGVARCKAVQAAREAGLRYLFFIDWDVLIPPDALVKLIYHLENNPDYGIAAGLYCIKSIPTYPILWREWNNGVAWDWTQGEVLMERVVGVPMGCTLLRLSIFDDLPTDDKPWFKTVDEVIQTECGPSAIKMTEDFYLCRRYLTETNGKILVDTSILCDHICHTTGRRYQLDPECLPMRRAAEARKSMVMA